MLETNLTAIRCQDLPFCKVGPRYRGGRRQKAGGQRPPPARDLWEHRINVFHFTAPDSRSPILIRALSHSSGLWFHIPGEPMALPSPWTL